MNYLKAEHLKFKRTISNKLLLIAPLLTALFAWIVGGFHGFQYMTFYWWYAFLLPGTIAILCSLAHQKEERAGKYYSVLSAPINLKQFEYAKVLILIEKLLVAAVFLAAFAAVSNLISPALAVYSMGRNFAGSVALMIASIWPGRKGLAFSKSAGDAGSPENTAGKIHGSVSVLYLFFGAAFCAVCDRGRNEPDRNYPVEPFDTIRAGAGIGQLRDIRTAPVPWPEIWVGHFLVLGRI